MSTNFINIFFLLFTCGVHIITNAAVDCLHCFVAFIAFEVEGHIMSNHVNPCPRWSYERHIISHERHVIPCERHVITCERGIIHCERH